MNIPLLDKRKIKVLTERDMYIIIRAFDYIMAEHTNPTEINKVVVELKEIKRKATAAKNELILGVLREFDLELKRLSQSGAKKKAGER